MKLSELKLESKFLDEDDGYIKKNLVVIVQDLEGDKHIMAEVNHDTGICNCCSQFYCEEQTIEVLKVYDGFTLEVLYENEGEEL